MNQFYISKNYLTLTGKELGEKDIIELKNFLTEKEIINKITTIELDPNYGHAIARGSITQTDIEAIWNHYESKGYLGRRVGDVKI